MKKVKKSIGEFIEENYNVNINDIWSEKNELPPNKISYGSSKRIWLKCLNDDTHPDYDLMALNAKNSIGCPYCAGKRVCYTNSLGYKYPELIPLWSDKNEKSIFEFTSGTNQTAYFKCENGIHEDYSKQISNQIHDVYMCPQCATITRIANMPRGEDSPYWKGNAVDENRRARDSREYEDWRRAAYEKDDYTCQCCGQHGGRLNAHHIHDFANHKELRFDETNSITLCASCHDSNIPGSFHNIYGTHGKTPEELEEYINIRREMLGIPIPFSIDSYLNGDILRPDDVENAKLGTWIFDIDPPEEKFPKIKPISRVKKELVKVDY